MLYLLSFLAAALFPLVLAGYGGHLATLALPDPKKQRKAIIVVWSLAALGVILFGVMEVFLYKSDTKRDAIEDSFRTEVMGKFQAIASEPDMAKREGKIAELAADLGAPRVAHLPQQRPSPPLAEVGKDADRQAPLFVGDSEGRSWDITPMEQNAFINDLLLYQTKNLFKEPLTIYYLLGERESFLLAEDLQIGFRNGGWNVQLAGRTDISYIQGLVLLQSSVELRPAGTEALRNLAKAASIPLELEEEPNRIQPDKFEILVGNPKRKDAVRPPL